MLQGLHQNIYDILHRATHNNHTNHSETGQSSNTQSNANFLKGTKSCNTDSRFTTVLLQQQQTSMHLQ